MQLLQARPLLSRRASRGDDLHGTGKQLGFPLGDLVRGHIEALGQLGERRL
jgi:hypothetical protein